MSGTLYVVATPIGNLEDITFRAVRVLREVDLVAAEDTRRTAGLLQHYSISTPTTSFHAHNERQKQGEFNWSSQHLDDEVLRCRNGDGEGQTGRVGLRCVRLVARQ